MEKSARIKKKAEKHKVSKRENEQTKISFLGVMAAPAPTPPPSPRTRAQHRQQKQQQQQQVSPMMIKIFHVLKVADGPDLEKNKRAGLF